MAHVGIEIWIAFGLAIGATVKVLVDQAKVKASHAEMMRQQAEMFQEDDQHRADYQAMNGRMNWANGNMMSDIANVDVSGNLNFSDPGSDSF